MRNASKIVLTVAVGGAMLGTVLSRMAEPVMQFAAAPDWRARFQTGFSATPLQSVDTGPQDLQPFGWTPGLLTAASAAEPLPVRQSEMDLAALAHDVRVGDHQPVLRQHHARAVPGLAVGGHHADRRTEGLGDVGNGGGIGIEQGLVGRREGQGSGHRLGSPELPGNVGSPRFRGILPIWGAFEAGGRGAGSGPECQ